MAREIYYHIRSGSGLAEEIREYRLILEEGTLRAYWRILFPNQRTAAPVLEWKHYVTRIGDAVAVELEHIARGCVPGLHGDRRLERNDMERNDTTYAVHIQYELATGETHRADA